MKLQVLYFSISSDEEEEEDESDRETEDPAIDSLSAAIKYQVKISIFSMYLLLVVVHKKNKLQWNTVIANTLIMIWCLQWGDFHFKWLYYML